MLSSKRHESTLNIIVNDVPIDTLLGCFVVVTSNLKLLAKTKVHW